MENFHCGIQEGKRFEKGPCPYEKSLVEEKNPTCTECTYHRTHLIPTEIKRSGPSTKSPRRKYKREDLQQNKERAKRSIFRYECLRRNPMFQKFQVNFFGLLKTEIFNVQGRGYNKEMRDYLEENKTITDDRLLEMMILGLWFPVTLKRKDPSELVKSMFDLPSIEVLSHDPEKMAEKLKFKSLEEIREKFEISPRDFLFGFFPDVEPDNTITIRMHLDRKKTDIEKDISYLLDALDRFGKIKDQDNRKLHLKPEHYMRVFKAYDLREEGGSWAKIARQVFPGEEIKNSTRKVRGYHEEAKKWIDEETLLR